MLLVLFLLVLCLLWALVEPHIITLRRDELAYPALPPGLEGLKIAFVSDLHCDSRMARWRVERAAEKLARLAPDVVILGGDYANTQEGAALCFDALAGLRPKHGVYAVPGNHDARYQGLAGLLKQHGITPLVNGCARIETEAGTLALVGLDDFLTGSPDPQQALAQAEGANALLLIAHNPLGIAPAAPYLPAGSVAYALCGHTHGGQVTIFGLWGPLSERFCPAYAPLWAAEGGVPTLYSNGLGTTAIPLRFFALPQIHLLTLVSAEKQG